MNKREKMMGLVFLALVGLWLLSSRSGSKAPVSEQPGPAPAPAGTPAATAPKTATASADGLRLLDRVMQQEDSLPEGEVYDPFRKFEARDLMDRKMMELSELKLKGILEEDGAYVALINDQILRRGDSVSGFRVAEIRRNEVILTRGLEKHTLRLFEEPE